MSAQASVAFMYVKGIGAEQGHLNSQFNLGVIYVKWRGVVKQDYSKSFFWYQKAAEQQDTTAQATLAVMHLKGIGAEKNTTAAFNWYHMAAEKEYLNSMVNLEDMCNKWVGVKQDIKQAFK